VPPPDDAKFARTEGDDKPTGEQWEKLYRHYPKDRKPAQTETGEPTREKLEKLYRHYPKDCKPAQTETGDDAKPTGEKWEKFFQQGTNRAWYWCPATSEHFFADDENSGWEKFKNVRGNITAWGHAANERFFFERAQDDAS